MFIFLGRAKIKLACEGSWFSINCGEHPIVILSANYGRLSTETCPYKWKTGHTNCKAEKSLSVVKER